MSHERLDPKVRKAAIVAAAYELAQEIGVCDISRNQVARFAGVSTGLVSRYFDIHALRTAVLQHAVEKRDWVMMRNIVAGPLAGSVRLHRDVKRELLKKMGAGR